MTATKSKLSFLELVYPPMSNQEAVWMKRDAKVEALLRQSDFYMIGGRAEAHFTDFDMDAEAGLLRFKFRIGDAFVDDVALNLGHLSTIQEFSGSTYEFELGEKIIRIWGGPAQEPGTALLDWFTTEKLVWERGQGRPGIDGFESYRTAATYDLLYVGIARKGDSFDRLIARGHQARMEILANEPQRLPGARVTDETYLFLFRVSPVIIATYSDDHDFTGHELDGDYPAKRIVADAEKAFVSLLQPQYNIETFASYPRGRDGLYGSEYVRYGYCLGEGFTFNTAHGRFRGARGPRLDHGDSIFVEGDAVSLFRAVEVAATQPSTRLAGRTSPPRRTTHRA